MRGRIVTLLALQASAIAVRDVNRAPRGAFVDTSDVYQRIISDLAQVALKQALQGIGDGIGSLTGSATSCNSKTVSVRKEWGSLSKSERLSYIKAVKCLQAKPPRTPSSVAPGVKNRFDDFVASHIIQTSTIHYTGNFLSWHRYFTWAYEEALRKECGYQGAQPYWDWAKTAVTGLQTSPIFDGSSTSLSGDGEFIPNQPPVVLIAPVPGIPPIYLDPGTGGGCLKSGPFKDIQVNLGPGALDVPGGGPQVVNPEGPLAYNPRCLTRSLTNQSNQRYANASALLSLIVDPDNVFDFQMQMQGWPGSGNIGVHGGGHYALGGDPGRDVFVSPADPVFYLHHSMVDRAWWIWQSLKPAERTAGPKGIGGTNTLLDTPPSANTTYDDVVDFGYAAGPARTIRDLMSTTAGPFCYVYA